MEKHIKHDQLKKFGYQLIISSGVPKDIGTVVIDGLVETSLRGTDSHGIRLLSHYLRAIEAGRINRNPKFSFRKTSASTGIFDADNGLGIAAGVAAMDHAMSLAKKTGIGAVSVKNSSHFGAAAIYGLRAAHANMLGLAMTDVDSLVFPYGGKRTYFGTNPICFAAPIEDEEPFCLDMATSRVPLNKIFAYRSAHKKLEKGWAFDASGMETTDPYRAVSPAPMGDYKGYGLAAMVSILSSLLSGMPFGPTIPAMFPLDNKKRMLGHFFTAIDISKFQPVALFKRRMKQMADELRHVTPSHPRNPVLFPGDPEKKEYSLRLKNGIPVSVDIIKELNVLAKQAHIAVTI